jgi:hypothetical protein
MIASEVVANDSDRLKTAIAGKKGKSKMGLSSCASPKAVHIPSSEMGTLIPTAQIAAFDGSLILFTAAAPYHFHTNDALQASASAASPSTPARH